jgi:hypothetical protein
MQTLSAVQTAGLCHDPKTGPIIEPAKQGRKQEPGIENGVPGSP